MKRLLITGSRDWTDEQAIKIALYNAWTELGGGRNVILVSGGAKGADKMAEFIWSINVGDDRIERYPAKDFPHPLKRNDHMVNLGADLCLAFPTMCTKPNCNKSTSQPDSHLSHGTDYTIKKARAAGIDTRIVLG